MAGSFAFCLPQIVEQICMIPKNKALGNYISEGLTIHQSSNLSGDANLDF